MFESTIVEKGQELHYKVYEFKLHPGKYKAELISPRVDSVHKKEVVFWKERGMWQVSPSDKNSRHLAQMIGGHIEQSEN